MLRWECTILDIQRTGGRSRCGQSLVQNVCLFATMPILNANASSFRFQSRRPAVAMPIVRILRCL